MELNIKNINTNNSSYAGVEESTGGLDIVSKFNRGIYQLHPYHLVEVSPWPIFTAFSLFGLTFNTVLVMHGYIGVVSIIFLNIMCLIYSMGLWFRDVVSEGTYLGNHTLAVRNGLNLGYILFVISEVMFFAGIFWAYGHSALAPTVELGRMWPPMGIEAIGPLELPLLNTILLLSSGATITYSHHALIAGKRNASLYSLAITVLLALLFTFCQYIEYVNASFTINDGVYGSTFYFSTGFHGLHVLIGGIMLIVSLWRMYAYHLTETHHVGYETSILYWHFVDLVWLFLFVAIYWWGS